MVFSAGLAYFTVQYICTLLKKTLHLLPSDSTRVGRNAWIEPRSELLTQASMHTYMGLLEYKSMPSLRDVAHDGVLCKILGRYAKN